MRALILTILLTPVSTLWIAPATLAGAQGAPQGSREVDRIVARIEGDIILESQVRELGAFQTLIEGHAESQDQLIQELIEQWEVQTEANDVHFPQPTENEVDRELDRLIARFETPAAYAAKIQALGLTAPEVRQQLTQQIFVERYLDYRFRPTLQIDDEAIEAYYHDELTAQLTANHQPVPPLPDVEEQIRELLTQKEISIRATQWLDDTKSRLKIEIAPSGSTP